MQGLKRRIVYVTLYELIAIVICGVALAAISGQGAVVAGALSVVCSAVAIAWNIVFNHGFEHWESRQPVRGRSLWRRIVHALAYECGLLTMLVPLLAWGLGVGLWQALLTNISLALFFMGYTFAFTWVFDRVFGLPAAAG